MIDNLGQDESIQNETDSLGFEVMESNLYTCKITQLNKKLRDLSSDAA